MGSVLRLRLRLPLGLLPARKGTEYAVPRDARYLTRTGQDWTVDGAGLGGRETDRPRLGRRVRIGIRSSVGAAVARVGRQTPGWARCGQWVPY